MSPKEILFKKAIYYSIIIRIRPANSAETFVSGLKTNLDKDLGKSMLPIQTKRLVLRVFNIGDANFVLELLNDPSWLRFIGDRGVRTSEQAMDWIQTRPIASQQQFGYSFYVVCDREQGIAMGICGLIKRDSLPCIDLGYAFLPRYTGQGYALEAAQAVVQHAEQDLHLTRLAAITDPDNERSNRLLNLLGFSLHEVRTLPGETRISNLYFRESKKNAPDDQGASDIHG